MSDLETRFHETVDYVKTAEGDFKPSNELKLELYGMYKQAMEGDVTGSRPGMMDFVNRAKYDAWADMKGVSRESAMQRYIDSIENLKQR